MARIVEVERDGMIHRGQYRIEGDFVIVSYGAKVKKREMRGSDEDPYVVARVLLCEIIAELRDNI